MNVINNAWEEVKNVESIIRLNHLPQGPRHVPVQHYDAIQSFKERLAENNIKVISDKSIISPDSLRLIYMADVEPNNKKTNGFNFSVGFLNNNDRSRAFTGICGTHTWVSDAEMYISDNSFKTRHTTYVKDMLFERSANIINWFNEYHMKQSGKIETMKNLDVTEEYLGKLIIKYIREKYTISSTNIKRLIEYFDDANIEEYDNKRSVWMLYNTTAMVFKKIKSPLLRLEAMSIFNEFLDETLLD
jgi:hypothetical protein